MKLYFQHGYGIGSWNHFSWRTRTSYCYLAMAVSALAMQRPGVSWSYFARHIPVSRNRWFNTLGPRQNGRHFADGMFKCIVLDENIWIPFKIYWSLFLRVQLTLFRHWFRKWLGADQVTNHYLKQWWSSYWCIYASLGLDVFRNLWSVILICSKQSMKEQSDMYGKKQRGQEHCALNYLNEHI